MIFKFSQVDIENYIKLQATTGIPHFIMLCFIVLHRYCVLFFVCLFVFYESKVRGNPGSRRSIGTIFPTALAHFVSLCHILVITEIFQTLHQ